MMLASNSAAWSDQATKTHKKNAQAQTYMYGMQTTSGNTCTCARDTLLGSLGVVPRHAMRSGSCH